MANCKKCDGEIGTYKINDIQFQVCKKCGVVIISEENFSKLAKKIDIDCKIIDLFALPPMNIKKDAIKCINCDEDMVQVYCEGVVIDKCDKCRLLLFDNGELSKYFSIFASKQMDLLSNVAFLKKYCNLDDVKKEEPDIKEGKIEMKIQSKEIEKSVPHTNGWLMVCVLFLIPVIGILLFILSSINIIFVILGFILGVPLFITWVFCANGFKILKPQEALVFTLFGKLFR